MANKNWPKDYPTHIQVPPVYAKPLHQKLFRMVENQTPTLSDFLPSYKDPLQSHLIKHSKFRNSPNYYGTSFNINKESLTKVINASPEKFSKKKVAEGFITKDMGVGEQKQGPHITIWLYENVLPIGFKVV